MQHKGSIITWSHCQSNRTMRIKSRLFLSYLLKKYLYQWQERHTNIHITEDLLSGNLIPTLWAGKTDAFIVSCIHEHQDWGGFKGHRLVHHAWEFSSQNTSGSWGGYLLITELCCVNQSLRQRRWCAILVKFLCVWYCLKHSSDIDVSMEWDLRCTRWKTLQLTVFCSYAWNYQACQLEFSERFYTVQNLSHTKYILFCNWMKQIWFTFRRMFFRVQNYHSHNTIHVVMNDGHFHFSGLVNKQYFWYWSRDNWCEIHQQCPPNSQKVALWCIISIAGIIGP